MLKDKGWNNHSCIKFLLSQKSEVSKIVVLENPAWALASGHVLSLKEMRLTLAFSSCCCCCFKHCLKIGSAGMYYFYATRPVYYTYQLLLYALRVFYFYVHYVFVLYYLNKVLPLVGFHWLLQFWPILNKCLHCPQNALAIKIEAQNPVPFTFTHCTVNTG